MNTELEELIGKVETCEIYLKIGDRIAFQNGVYRAPISGVYSITPFSITLVRKNDEILTDSRSY